MIDNLISYNITSASRNSGTTDNFNIKLDIPNDILNKLTSCSITDVSIPKSFYQIVNNYNTFHLYEDNNLIIITIEQGNYSKSQLYAALSTKMINQSLNNIKYNVSDEQTLYDTGKMKITATNELINKSLIFQNNDMYKAMGFNINKEYTFTTTLISENIINLNSEDVLLLHSNITSNYNNDLIGGSNVLCSIYTSGQKNYSYIIKSYDLIYNMKKFIPNNNMTFYLTNEQGENINLGGIDFNFVLNLFTYIPNSKIYNKIDQIINYSLLNE
jgi:hypothetical protein